MGLEGNVSPSREWTSGNQGVKGRRAQALKKLERKFGTTF